MAGASYSPFDSHSYRLEARNMTVPEVTEQAEVEHPTHDCFQPE